MSEYRKRKTVPAIYRELNGGEARISMSEVPDKALEGFCIYNGSSELDVKEQTDTYILVGTDGVEVEELTIAYDEIPEKEEEDNFQYERLESAIKNVEDAIYATEKDESDNTPLITALEAIKRSVSDLNIPEVQDYTKQLEYLFKAIVEGSDRSAILDRLDALLLKETPTFEIPPQLISDNRIKVEVDRIGGGGGSDVTYMENLMENGVAVKAGDSPSIDAFGRWRTSEPFTIFDSKQIFDNGPLFWDDQEVSGGGTSSTHSANLAASVMQVSASTAGRRVRQTFQRFNYQPGKSQQILCTGVLNVSGGGTGIKQAFGYYDDKNGLFLQNNEGTIQFVKRSYTSGSAVDIEVDQADWNLDKMDGTGASGITLDFTKAQILFIDFEWLGVGRVRMGFVVDGNIYYCHEFNHANNIATVYMSTPNLPIRYEISNDGNGGAAVMTHICSSVVSEGGQQYNGLLHHADSGAVSSLSANTSYVIMGGRLKSTYLGANVILENVSIIGSANDQAHWEFVVGGTVGATLTYNDKTSSAVQIAIGSASHTHTGGIPIDGGYFTTNQAAQFTVPNAVKLGSTIAGTPQEWYLVVTPITNNITVRASVTWRELN